MSLSVNKEKEILQDRPYQRRAWKNMVDFTKQRLRNTLKNPKKIDLWTSMPINMATGSGKTYTVGDFLKQLYYKRNILEKVNKQEIPINTLVLNDRITLVDQLEQDFIEGRDGKPPLLGQNIKHHASVKLFHSEADSTGNIDIKDETKVVGSGKDTVYFSSFGSAKRFEDEDMAWDIIVVDEGHHLHGPTYLEILKKVIARSEAKTGRTPLIIPMSATIDPILDIVNDPVVNYGLAEYIAGPYSPDVEYNLVTSSDFTTAKLKDIYLQIQQIGELADFREKKKQIEELRLHIEQHLAKFGGLTELVHDIVTRLELLDHTVIFASSIEEVDDITAEINKQVGANTAVALHSKIDEADKNILADYRDGKKKVIVAVDKLNEGIDLPYTKNVVFWRDVKSPTVFQQQFGRGLRGDLVRYFDYTGVLRNMAWIQGINQDIKDLVPELLDELEGIDDEETQGAQRPRKGITVLFGEVRKQRISNEISLESVIAQLQKIEDENVVTPEVIKEGLDNLGGYDELVNWSRAQIATIWMYGSKIYALAKLYGFKSKQDLLVTNPVGFQEFLAYVYGKEFTYEKLTKEIIKTELDNLGGYHELMKYKYTDLQGLDVKGNKIFAIAKVYGFVSEHDLNIGVPIGFKEFISFVYEKPFTYKKVERVILKKEDIIKFLDDLGGYDALMKYSIEQVKNLEIKGNKINSVVAAYGFVSKHALNPATVIGFQEFVSAVYEQPYVYEKIEKPEKQELEKTDIIPGLDLLGGYDALSKYNSAQIIGLDLKGNKLTTIIKTYGFQSVHGLNIKTPTGFQEFLAYVYNKPFTYIKPEKADLKVDDVKKIFDKLGGYAKLMKYKQTQVVGIDIQGNKIISIARACGFKSANELTPDTPTGFYEFVSFLYGQEFKYEKSDKEKITTDEIKKYFDDLGGYSALMKYKRDNLKGLSLKGNKVLAMAGIYGFKSSDESSMQTPAGFQQFLAFIYGE